MAKWKHILVKNTPKENGNEFYALKSTSKNALDTKELYEERNGKQSVVIN